MIIAQSPWWYRGRGYVIGAIYFLGFVLGALLWGIRSPDATPAAVWIGRHLSGPAGIQAMFVLATLCLAACFAIRLWGSAYLSASVVWNPDALADRLIVDGPFRFLRNPLYLGNLLMALGFGLLATLWGFAIILIGNAIFIRMLVRYEAVGLRARYGSIYDAYATVVPALLPRFTPAVVAGSVRGTPDLGQGLRSEIFSGCCAAAMLIFLLYGDRVLSEFYGLIVAGWIIQALATRLPRSTGSGGNGDAGSVVRND